MRENDWEVLNRIILEIYSAASLIQMRENLLYQLKLLISYDSAEFFLYDADSGFCEPVFYNPPSDAERYTKYINISDLGKFCLSDESGDVFCEEEYAMGDFSSTADFEYLFRPYQREHALTMVLRCGGICGMVNLYRSGAAFDERERFIARMAAPHAASRICKTGGADGGKLTVAQCARTYGLTKREETVLRCLISGGESAQICDELGISNNTLKKHILNIYRKVGIRNRVQMYRKIRE